MERQPLSIVVYKPCTQYMPQPQSPLLQRKVLGNGVFNIKGASEVSRARKRYISIGLLFCTKPGHARFLQPLCDAFVAVEHHFVKDLARAKRNAAQIGRGPHARPALPPSGGGTSGGVGTVVSK
eukprot:6027721-Pyramimonas_sp.AAC.1